MEVININNEETAQCIWNEALQRSCKPFSWGLDFGSIETIEGGTSFRVKTASVKIRLEKMGLFTVIVIPDDNQKSQIVCNELLLGSLVPAIDEAIKYGKISSKPQYRNIQTVAERLAV